MTTTIDSSAGGHEVQALFASRIASSRYVSAIATEPVESKPAVATATLLAPKARGAIAIARWKGNLAAHRYDLQTRRRAGAWAAPSPLE